MKSGWEANIYAHDSRYFGCWSGSSDSENC